MSVETRGVFVSPGYTNTGICARTNPTPEAPRGKLNATSLVDDCGTGAEDNPSVVARFSEAESAACTAYVINGRGTAQRGRVTVLYHPWHSTGTA